MSNFLFENVLLTVGLQASASLGEWEAASLTVGTGALSALSLEFFFSYFNFFSATVVVSGFVDSAAAAYLDVSGPRRGLGQLFQIHGALAQAVGLSAAARLADYRSFLSPEAILPAILAELPAGQLYGDWAAGLATWRAAGRYGGSHVSALAVSAAWLHEASYSFDWLLLSAEVGLLVFLLGYAARATAGFPPARVFYDDIVTFCKLNNVSFVEVGIFFSLFLGFLLFDLFMCSVDEDVTDVFSYFMVTFVILLFFFLVLGIDVQYYYMISSVSSGDLSARVVAFDVINNFLCILRIFFCWVRYIFYDLQVELVDFSFHYTDSVNDLNVLLLFDNAGSSSWFESSYAVGGDSSVVSVTRAAWWVFTYIYIDVCFVVLQILLGFVKLFIAFFLLWLIVDLFILKAFAHSESSYLATLRSSGR